MISCDDTNATPSRTLTTTIKPTPPPKPTYLTSAFTGTLDSDALRTFVRQQSLNHSLNSSILHNTSPMPRQDDATDYEMTNETTNETDEEDDLKWGTAKQSQSQQQTPIKPAYGKLSDLFSQGGMPASDSTNTIKEGSFPTRKTHRYQPDSRDYDENMTIRLPQRKKRNNNLTTKTETTAIVATIEAPTTPNITTVLLTETQASPAPSAASTQRSRQPSVLSDITNVDDDQEVSIGGGGGKGREKKKNWLHISDECAFELATTPTSSTILPPVTSSQSRLESRRTSVAVLAGPPPLRPASIAVEVPPVAPSDDIESSAAPPPRQNPVGRQARALYAFQGEASFNELSLASGQMFHVLKEDVGGGWSLACVKREGNETSGLVPHGWYTYVQEFSRSPHPTNEDEKEQVEPTTLKSEGQATSSLLLNPPPATSTRLSRSNSSSSSSKILSPKDALEQQKRWDRSRPASGFGQVYSGISQTGSAIQVLTQMQRTKSNSSYFLHKGTSPSFTPLTIGEVDAEEVDTSLSNCGSEAVVVSTSSTTPSDETVAQSNMESKQTVDSPGTAWKPTGFLGGRSLNRFSPFVTSGAESYILQGPSMRSPEASELSRYHVSSGTHGGPCWRHPGLSIVVKVHSPEVHETRTGGEYIAYVVHSSYLLFDDDEVGSSLHELNLEREASMTSSVYRRFNQFRWLYNSLARRFPSLMASMPGFPNASYAAGKMARMDLAVAEQRRRHLHSWLSQVARHTVLSDDIAVRFFLDSEEEDDEWVQSAQKIQRDQESLGESSMSIFSSVDHPHFNVDISDAALEASHMSRFSQAFHKGMSLPEVGVLPTFQALRAGALTTSDSYRQMSYALLRLMTGSSSTGQIARGRSAGALDNQPSLPPMGKVGLRDESGATNEERAWCWRDGCKDCKRLTRSMQKTAEAFQDVADKYEVHSNSALFELHDRLAMVGRMNQQHASLIDVHKATLAMYRDATGEPDPLVSESGSPKGGSSDCSSPPTLHGRAERVASRCETVLNVTMSEMDRIHSERIQDWTSMTRQLIDSQIGFYDGIVTTLKHLRQDCILREQGQDEVVTSNGALLPSPYEAHLQAPSIRSRPLLLQPEAPTSSSSSYFGIW